MKLTQFLIFEICPECNYAAKHPKCPSSDRRRYASLDTSRSLTTRDIIRMAVDAYQWHGFRGFVGFHYYNEPTLRKEQIYRIMEKVREQVPETRFVLWTNGSCLGPEDLEDLAAFDLISVSRYGDRDYAWLEQAVKDGVVKELRYSPGELDDRLNNGDAADDNRRCVRPYTEFIVDYFGNVHLCCIDWQGKASVGNVFRDDFGVIVKRFQQARASVSTQPMDGSAPAFCKACRHRYETLSDYDKAIAQDAKNEIETRDSGQPNENDLHALFMTQDGRWRSVVPTNTPSLLGRNPHTSPLFAVINTWMEADIIEANVLNCFAQGCDRVFLLDNQSPDDTVERALGVGAELAGIYETDFFQNSIKYRLLNEFMAGVTAKEGQPYVWWLCLDADELPTGPHGLTIREFLETLNPAYNTVGAYAFEHYPTTTPANLRRFHPADLQPYGMVREAKFCSLSHWKHLLFRAEPDYPMGTWRGSHGVWARKEGVTAIEPTSSILIHHFMYRNRADTEARLTAMCSPRSEHGGKSRASVNETFLGGIEGDAKRLRNLERVYAKQWDQVEPPHAQMLDYKVGVPVDHWSKLLAPATYGYKRWYTLDELQAAVDKERAVHHA